MAMPTKLVSIDDGSGRTPASSYGDDEALDRLVSEEGLNRSYGSSSPDEADDPSASTPALLLRQDEDDGLEDDWVLVSDDRGEARTPPLLKRKPSLLSRSDEIPLSTGSAWMPISSTTSSATNASLLSRSKDMPSSTDSTWTPISTATSSATNASLAESKEEKDSYQAYESLIENVKAGNLAAVERLIKDGLSNLHVPWGKEARTLKLIASLEQGHERHTPRRGGKKPEEETDRQRKMQRKKLKEEAERQRKMQGKIAKLLIKRSRPDQLQAQDIDGNTELMLAIIHGVDPIVKRLLRYTNLEQLKITNRFGQNALLLALDRHRVPATRYLLAAGADVPNANGHTALFAAVEAENASRVDVLIKAGVMINQTGPKHATPLSMAISKGNTQLVKTLLDLGAHADPGSPQADLPLMIAARRGSIEIITELLEHGASAQRVNAAGIGALHIAAKYGHVRAMAVLIANGADPAAQDRYGVAPLHAAAYHEHVEAVQLLINKGAPLECIDWHGCTPLHYAARFGGGDCCKLLISRGADIHATDRIGTGVLVKARMSGDQESYAALITAHRSQEGDRSGCVLL